MLLKQELFKYFYIALFTDIIGNVSSRIRNKVKNIIFLTFPVYIIANMVTADRIRSIK